MRILACALVFMTLSAPLFAGRNPAQGQVPPELWIHTLYANRETSFYIVTQAGKHEVLFYSNTDGNKKAALSEKNYQYLMKKASKVPHAQLAPNKCTREKVEMKVKLRTGIHAASACIDAGNQTAQQLVDIANLMAFML